MKLKVILFALVTICSSFLFGQNNSCYPAKQLKLVYDEADILSSEQEEKLNQELVQFDDSTSNQILVITTTDLCGLDKSQYAIGLGDFFGVGQAKERNGVVLLVKPKTPDAKGETFIAIGRGLEGAIPDGGTYLIIEREMIPLFKEGKYFEGITSATDVLKSLASKEYSISEYGSKRKKNTVNFNQIALVVGLVFCVFILVLVVKIRQAKKYAIRNNVTFWTAWVLLNEIQRRQWSSRGGYRGGGMGGFGGGGFGGGGSGGGFGGFGGGSFGGGGAGGSW